MSNKTQIHFGDGDNLQDSTKYQDVGKVVLERKQRTEKKPQNKNWKKWLSILALPTLLLFLFLVAKFWVRPICDFVTREADGYQFFKSIEVPGFNGTQLCESQSSPK